MSDDANNDQGEGGYRWMTYRELAAALAISLPAAEARVRRGRWRKQEGNDGTMRVAVPVAVLQPAPNPAMQGPTINALLDALKASHEATTADLQRRVAEAEARIAAAEAARDAAEGRERAALAEVISAQRDRLADAEQLAEAKAAVARLTVELEEARQPWWRRAFTRRG
jgi:hypothetical protein